MSSNLFKVMTYNIHKGFSAGNRRFILHNIRDVLLGKDIDVVFLQELLGEHRNHQQQVTDWPDKTQYEFLGDRVWRYHAYGKNAIYDAGHHGNAILSRLPLESWQNINLSSFKKASRSLLHGIVRRPDDDFAIHVICIHFCLLAFERRRQLRSLRDYIDNHISSQEPLVVAGDFNDWTQRAERHLCAELGLKEIFHTLEGKHARTFPIHFPVFPMDRIYYRKLKPVGCQRFIGNPWCQLSDHAPLYAIFALEGGSTS